MNPAIVYRPDCLLTPAEDASLRALFAVCFKRELAYLEHQRFFRELPSHRWMVYNAENNVIAHIAVYDKVLGTLNGLLPVAGVAEVCVHPDYRGQGLARAILVEVHAWARAQGFAFTMLFGARGIYGGSGYVPVDNPIRSLNYKTGEWETEPVECAMVCPLSEIEWPQGEIDLRGPGF